MLINRCLPLYRKLNPILNAACKRPSVQIVRHSGGEFRYRLPPAPMDLRLKITSQGVGAFAWWWILWHLWHEPEHIYGEFPYPDPSLWTNEELGIPPDDADE